jgi:hypothetical protein
LARSRDETLQDVPTTGKPHARKFLRRCDVNQADERRRLCAPLAVVRHGPQRCKEDWPRGVHGS